MNILVSGSHGLIGSALVALLASRGHRVVRLVRPPAPPSRQDIPWDPAAGAIDGRALEGMDAVIHLAGESIAAGRWTQARKIRIRDSRVGSTRLLADTLARLTRKPQVLLCASAVGFYGNRGDEILVEESASGAGFLADLCQAWEAAAEPARQAGIRVAYLRTGVVLSPLGGALAKMLPIFRIGLGGRLGRGRQFMSWITLDDEVEAISHVLTHTALRGPVNLVSPQPVTNREFTSTLGRVLRRPTPFVVPGGILRAALGEVAGEVLGSVRAHPAKLLDTGFGFRYPELEGGLRHLLEQGTAHRPPV
jgi:uncharacterized protein (TIGR01777 family)